MFNNANQHINVYGDDIEVDYRGYEVSSFLSPPLSPPPSLPAFSLSALHVLCYQYNVGDSGELSESTNW